MTSNYMYGLLLNSIGCHLIIFSCFLSNSTWLSSKVWTVFACTNDNKPGGKFLELAHSFWIFCVWKFRDFWTEIMAVTIRQVDHTGFYCTKSSQLAKDGHTFIIFIFLFIPLRSLTFSILPVESLSWVQVKAELIMVLIGGFRGAMSHYLVYF